MEKRNEEKSFSLGRLDIVDLYEWHTNGKLVYETYFQRQFVWKEKDKKDKGASVAGFKLNKTMLEMAKGFTVKRIISMVGGGLTKEQILDINAQLNKIKKREK